MKKTLIIITIAVVVLTLITTVLMFSSSGTSPIKLYWAVDCATEDNCSLTIRGDNFIGEEENSTAPAVNNYTASGSMSVEEQRDIDDPDEIPWKQYRRNIRTVNLGDEFKDIVPANMFAWFYGMENLENIDFSYVDSSSVSSFSYLFYGCSSIRNLDLSPLRVIASVAGSSEEVYTYTYIDTITTSNINYLIFEYGFWQDENTTEVYYASETPTGENTTYRNITPKFYYKVDDGVLYITSTETEGYDWNYEGSRNKWFDRYSEELNGNITSVVVEDFHPITMYELFANLTTVTSIDLDGINTSNTIDMSGLFYNCKKIKSLDLSKVNTSNIEGINHNEPSDLFINCISLKSVTINENFDYALSEGVWLNSSNISFSNGLIETNVNETYTRRAIYWGVDASKEKLTISGNYVNAKYNGAFDYLEFNYSSPLSDIPWISYASTIKTIEFGGPNDYIQPVNMDNWFKGFEKVKTIDLTYFDSSKVEEMDSTFSGMTKLESIDFSGLTFDNLIIADSMFINCTSLTDINLTGFNPPLLESMVMMFKGCSSLEEINMPSLEVEYLNMVTSLFEGCTSLKIVNIANMTLNPSNFYSLDDYADIFYGCNKISQITIGPNNAVVIKSQLGNPNSEYIEGANGKWYDSSLQEYDVSELPEDTIGTYYATSPVEISFYNSENSTLLSKTMYAYGSKVRLNIPCSKSDEVSQVMTQFVSSDGQTFDNVVTNKTTKYVLTGYSDGNQTYEFDSEYVLKSNKSFTTVFEESEVTYDTITLPVPTRFGYIFKGWSLNEDDTTGLVGAYTPEVNSRFHALWEEIVHEYLDNTESIKYVIGRTKSLVFRINADISLFKNLFVGDNELEKDVHYTATSGSTVLTFTDEGMRYLENLGPGLYEIKAGFTDTDNISLATLTLEEVGKHLLTIHYKYSGQRSDESVFDDYNASLEEDTEYSVISPSKDKYNVDIEVVSGTMGKSNIEVTVTYTPKNDKNNNGIADEDEPKQEESTNTDTNTSTDTNTNSNTEKSPKTKDKILTYVILEIVSVLAAVIIFIRIKAH